MKYPWWFPFPIAIVRATGLCLSVKLVFYSALPSVDSGQELMAALFFTWISQMVMMAVFDSIVKDFLYWLSVRCPTWFPGREYLKQNYGQRRMWLTPIAWQALIAPVVLLISVVVLMLFVLPFSSGEPQSLGETKELLARLEVLWVVIMAYLYNLDCWFRINLVSLLQKLRLLTNQNEWDKYVLTESELKVLLQYAAKNPPRKRVIRRPSRSGPKPRWSPKNGTVDAELEELKRRMKLGE